MNKILKRILSAGVAVCMLPVFSGTVGVKAAPTASCNYSFDKAADFNAIKGTFYEKYQENGTDIWHSAFEHSTAQTDVFGDSTGAVHIKWNKYDAIGKNDKGTDSFFRIPNPDYSGKTYTSFDFKLDNSNSTIQVYNRVPVGGSPKSLAFINASATSLKLLGKTVDASITPDTWYHVSFVTEYDGDKTVTGSAWLNGEKVITDAQTVYAQKPDCIDGTTNAANFLTFVCYYNKAGETGAWFDNLTFNKAENLNINNMTVTPENGEVIESGDITCTFGADVDAATLDTNDITLTKDGTEIAFESAQLSANKLRLRIADADITPGAAFEITLPEAEDVIGNSIEESKRIISYSVEAPEPEAPLELVSPKNGTYVARGDALVLAADAEEAADAVSFWSNGEKLGDGVKNGDLWTYEWQPRRYGEYEITAKYGEHEKSADVTVMKSTVQSGVWALSGSNLSTGAPVYSGTDGRKPAYAMNGTKAVDSYSATDPKITVAKGGIYTLEADVYTDSNGDGVTSALSTAPNAMKNSMNMFIIQGGNLYAKRGGDMWAEGVFGKNEWHTFKTVIDMTGSVNVYDVFVDGIQYADDIEFSNANFTELVGRIKIQLTNTAEGDVFMDNVRLSTLTEASSVYVLTTSPANGTYVEAGDGVMLTASLADDFGDAVDFESVSFSVNGEYVGEGEKISDKQYGIMWTPEAGGKVIVRINATAEDQEFEKEFELEVFDQYNKTSVTNRYFTYNAGKIVLESDGETSATTSNAGDTSIAVNLIGFKEQGSESGSSCYVQINANKVTKGFVVYEFDVYVTNKEQGIRVYNRPDGTNVPDTPVNFVKGKVCYGSESGATVDTGYTYEANKWYNVKVVWDVDNARRDLYLDGVQIVSGVPVRFSAEKNISQIRGEITNLWKSAGIVTIKNEAVRFASVAPVAQSIAAYDADGKELDIANLDVSKAASIEVTYSQALLAKNINSSNIKLRRGYGKQIEVSDVTVSAKGDNAVKITLGENALDASAHYILTLDSVANSFGVVSDIKEFEIRTAADVKGMYQASFTLNGNEISDITELFEGNTVVFEAKAISPKAEKCYAVITVNTADGKLAAMAVTPVSFDSANSETDVTASLKLNFTPSEGDVMKAFLWDANTLPFGDEFILD